MMDLTICRARLMPGCSNLIASELVDVAVHDGHIASVTAHEEMLPGAIDADGGTLLPGLWDAHVHFSTHALLAECLQLTPEADLSAILHRVRKELGLRASGGLLVGFGYRSSTWPTDPTAAMLDDL